MTGILVSVIIPVIKGGKENPRKDLERQKADQWLPGAGDLTGIAWEGTRDLPGVTEMFSNSAMVDGCHSVNLLKITGPHLSNERIW